MCKCGIVVRLLFLLYANLLILVTLCEGNHYPFIEERYEEISIFRLFSRIFFVLLPSNLTNATI